MSRSIFARAAALSTLAVVALAACTQPQEPDESSQPTSDSSAEQAEEISDEAFDTATDGTDESDDAAEAPAPEAVVVPIGTELTDPETGDVITIVSAVRHVPTEFYEINANPDGEMVYLEISVVPGDQFSGSIAPSSFFITSAGEEADWSASADEELIAAGYEYFDSPRRMDGPATGYVPIFVPEPSEAMTGAYVRPEAKPIGQDTILPEFRGEFDIPAN
ncbi:MAG: hypothetical protein ACK5KU_02310 [Beutenbergiaceae bacterium]